ncbi:MAG: DUF4124 domain-containing protein [Burkholderiales bacterium]
MRHRLAIVLVLAAAAVPAAETYRWVDEKGVVNYGEKPPPNRPAKPVNTEPTGIIESGSSSAQKGDAGKTDERRPQVIAVPVPVPAPAGPAVRGMEFDTFIRLQTGMSEGELLVRAGRPDHESIDNLADYDRTFYYFPTVANPYTTMVRLRSGRIVSLDRVKQFR